MASNSTWRGEVGEGGLFKKQQKSKLDNEGVYYFAVFVERNSLENCSSVTSVAFQQFYFS